jgi:3-methyladenine DNA glycosylase AlkD
MGAGAAILEGNEKGSTVNAKKLAASIDKRLREGTNPGRREATLGYYPSQMQNLGVGAPHLRKVVREVRREIKGQDARAALAVARAVVAQKTLEGRQAAYEILVGHPGALETLSTRDVEALGKGMDNWMSVDGFSCFVAGRAWNLRRISDRDVLRWAQSKDRWWRRAAVASTVPLNLPSRGGEGDTKRTLMILDEVLGDRDPMVAKAVSWALRTLIRHDRVAVERYLKKHGDVLPALVSREVGNKLRTGKKNPGRGSKKSAG